MNRLNARGIALTVFVMATLGGSYTMVKVGLADLPVFGLLLLRMLVASAVLALYMAWSRLPFAYRGRARWFVLAQAIAFTGSQSLLYMGLAQTSAGRGGILLNTQPFITLLLLPLFVPTEKVTSRRLLGTVAAFFGVLVLMIERGTSGGTWAGDLMVLTSAALWASNVIMNKTMPAEIHPVSWSSGTCPVRFPF